MYAKQIKNPYVFFFSHFFKKHCERRHAHVISINGHCIFRDQGRLIHRLLHLIGLYDEHLRRDRNKYVKLNQSHPSWNKTGKARPLTFTLNVLPQSQLFKNIFFLSWLCKSINVNMHFCFFFLEEKFKIVSSAPIGEYDQDSLTHAPTCKDCILQWKVRL